MKAAGSLASRLVCFKRLFGHGRQLPVYLLMFVTNRCAAACEHCFYWRSLNQKRQEELTLPEFDRLTRSLGPLFQVTLTGGSPELRPDLPEIAQIFSRNCRPSNLTICMLGHATDRILEHAERIVALCPTQRVNFALSLDGLGEEHDRLRRLPGCYERVLATLDGLAELRRREPRVRTTLGLTVHGLNYQSVERTARWAREHLPVDVMKPILVRGDPRNKNALNRVCVDAYLRVVDGDRAWLEERDARTSRFFDYLVNSKESVQRDIIASISRTGKFPGTCAGGREAAVVYPTGDVAGCETRPDVLGNLREADFDFPRIWLGPTATRFRQTAGKTGVCSGCYHHCFISPMIFRTPNFWPGLARSFSARVRHTRPPSLPVSRPCIQRASPEVSLPDNRTASESDPRTESPARVFVAASPKLPNVLVVIPAYRAEQTLPHCLRAVRHSNNDRPWEVMVVDDNDAGEPGVSLPLSSGVRVVRSPRGGSAAAARNFAASNLKQGILVFLDADVVLEPHAIDRLIQPIAEGTADATVGNYSSCVDGMDFLQRYKQLYISTVYGRRAGPLHHEFWTAIGAIRAEVLHELGGFDERYGGACGEDTDLGHRLTAAGHRIVAVPGATGLHLHRFTFWSLLRNDFRKGTQVMLCGLRRGRPVAHNRHSSRRDVLAVGFAGLACVGLALVALTWNLWPCAGLPVGSGLAWCGCRSDFLSKLTRSGITFLCRAIPLAFLLDLVRGLCVGWALTSFVRERLMNSAPASGRAGNAAGQAR
jgi:MoaA/NifB/PqqE/SkfB family radical SAM enzyme